MKCKCDTSKIEELPVEEIQWDKLCEECQVSLDEYISTGGECGVAHAERVGSAIQAGFSASDAKLYARQERPVQDLGPSDEKTIAYWENRTP